jgi:hypothetical protein
LPSFLLSSAVWGDDIRNKTNPGKFSLDLEEYRKHCKS